MKARVPKIWRKKRTGTGKEYGACLATLAGEDVNLGTGNYELARRRLVEALRGKRDFPSDAEMAAQALEADIEGAAAGQMGLEPQPTIGQQPAAAPSAPAAPPIVPDHIMSPRALPPMSPGSEADARAEADATNAAAAETGGAGGDAAPGPEAFITPDALEGMLVAAAEGIVEVQIALQAFVIEKRTGKRPQQLPPEVDAQFVAPLRKAAAQAWVVQFKRWFPDMDDVPPWILAAGLPLLVVPIQVATAKPVEKQADPAPAQAAA
jgi:hypothetical protein